MFALRSVMGGKPRGEGDLPAHAGIVFPRALRRPARVFSHLISSGYEPPRYLGLALLAAFFATAGAYGAVIGGHVPTIVSAITARSGFAVSDIRVSGNIETSEIDVLGQLDLTGFTSLISLDAAKVRGDIESLPWVKNASVRKVYPDALEINIEEHKPFAIWQQGEALSVIQADGSIIARFSSSHSAGLPLVIGSGAPKQAAIFVRTVARHPFLSKRVTAYSLIANRRWNLRLDNGVTIKLPEKGVDAALAELAQLDQRQALLSRGIVSVDMRLADRISIKLVGDDASVIRASMREKLGISKKRGQRT